MLPPIREYKQASYPHGNITQWFGENPEIYSKWGLKAHNGVDCVAPHGEPLFAVEDGVVVDVKNTPEGYGKHVRFFSDREVNGTKREWTYGHMHTITVSVGDHVKAGDQIGTMGNTGFVISGATPFWEHNPYAGTHLHLGLRMVKLSDSGWQYNPGTPRIKVLNYNNGYMGSVNPAPYFTNTTTKQQKMMTLISLLNTVVSLLQKLSTVKQNKHL